MKNWRTSAIGGLGAVAVAVGGLVQGGGQIGTKDLIMAAVMAVLGFFAKDAGQSGGEL